MNFEKWWKNKHPEIMGTPEVSERDFNLMRDAWETSKAAEREACAKVCEEESGVAAEMGHERFARYSAEMAGKIRMRSNV